MILDSHGTPLRRAIGFISGFVPVRKALPLVDALYVVGVQVDVEEAEEAEAEDDGAAVDAVREASKESDAARNRDRTRRAG